MTDYQELPPETRVWVYQANQPFNQDDEGKIRNLLATFADQWVSHNRQLRAHADLWHQRFVVLMVDETMAGASGCSIDSSVHFLQQMQGQFGRDLFDRMRFSYKKDDQVYTLSRADFARAYQIGEISDNTPVFDTLVKSKKELDQAFIKPLAESWHARMV